jgi:hypothetical protein
MQSFVSGCLILGCDDVGSSVVLCYPVLHRLPDVSPVAHWSAGFKRQALFVKLPVKATALACCHRRSDFSCLSPAVFQYSVKAFCHITLENKDRKIHNASLGFILIAMKQ